MRPAYLRGRCMPDCLECPMPKLRVALLLLLACLGASGCVVEGRRDGGVTVRPIHIGVY